jgi:mono/diheme cytochrome c family protein
MKKLIIIAGMAVLVYACSGGGESKDASATENQSSDLFKEDKAANSNESKGIGKFTHVELSPTLDVKMAEAGKMIYDVKCNACHKLTKEKLVGPGWLGVTSRRSPEWIMNFATNPDEMLNKDPDAQALLAECLVRMPNQQLSDDDARHMLELMRQNDGVK